MNNKHSKKITLTYYMILNYKSVWEGYTSPVAQPSALAVDAYKNARAAEL